MTETFVLEAVYKKELGRDEIYTTYFGYDLSSDK